MFKSLLSIMLFVLCCGFVIAADEARVNQSDPSHPVIEKDGLVNINVGVDLTGFEQPAAQVAQALADIAETMSDMSARPELTSEEKQQVLNMMSQIETLTVTLDNSLIKLPSLVEQASLPIVESSQTFLGDLKVTVILILIALFVVICLALYACYYLLLRPTKDLLIGTIGELNQLASAMENTAKIVELSGQHHATILAAIERQRMSPQHETCHQSIDKDDVGSLS
ncbi:hypothetical protein [Motilimonas sp. E26]|uniref:hypothetical protein n=1 Tax=Motilimonas sp. E26 TaxID=2865674 RepID=UPI001E62D3A0|nr:hypothetical protein [Motilimonas sp. E26]MCE0555396.1 hypothetical protein [Motilimonas sp. E26]